VAFYKTSFGLNLPESYDIPLAFEFSNCSAADDTLGTNFRALLYVNGWQFGKYGKLSYTTGGIVRGEKEEEES
jgi:hypothetical protein